MQAARAARDHGDQHDQPLRHEIAALHPTPDALTSLQCVIWLGCSSQRGNAFCDASLRRAKFQCGSGRRYLRCEKSNAPMSRPSVGETVLLSVMQAHKDAEQNAAHAARGEIEVAVLLKDWFEAFA
eukprot:6064738-Amphidinium_carterae.1